MNNHESVLDNQLKQFLEQLIKTHDIKTIVDCTYGAGNHSKIALNCGLKVYGFDQDINVKPMDNIEFCYENFSNINKTADVWMADLGMSDMQLQSDRGFSFMRNTDGLLDMRMNQNSDKKPLKDIINYMPKYEIVRIIKEFGEEPMAKIIASNIELYRIRNKIRTTQQFLDAIGINKYSVLARVFQAFRIYINDELNTLKQLLNNIDKYTIKAACIITFHSLEDRIVKHHWKKYNGKYLTDENNQKKARSSKLRFFIL